MRYKSVPSVLMLARDHVGKCAGLWRWALFPLATAISTQGAGAAVYYIDANAGSDTWAGTQQAAGAANGPWRSLTRLASATLAPGDSVLLACGHSWSQTLTFLGSGTATSPIRVGTFPANCASPPTIDGQKQIPSSAWQLHNGNIYKAALSTNLVPNGMLALGATNWSSLSSKSDTQIIADSTCGGQGFGCLRFNSGSVGGKLASPPFPVTAGTTYSMTIRLQVPKGVAFTLDLRRNSAPGAMTGMATTQMLGTGGWQTVKLPIKPTVSVSDARIDLTVTTASMTSLVRDVGVIADTTSDSPVNQVFENGVGLTVAHHPNQGHNKNEPTSYFLRTAAPSATVTDSTGRSGSNTLTTGSDLTLPPGASLAPGLKLRLRSSDWSVGEHTVTAVNLNKVGFSPNSLYALNSAGWGYFFTGALWMLDSPGEWFFDSTSSTLYVQTSNNAPPGGTISFSGLDRGLDLRNKSYVTVSGIAFKRTYTGVDMSPSTSVQLLNVQVEQTGNIGIFAANSSSPVVRNSIITNTLGDAILAYGASSVQVVDNDITNSGVRQRNDKTTATLPNSTWGAINAGKSALITGNRIKNTSYDGINVNDDSVINGNAITNFCLVLNDCGAIHTFKATRLTITNNLIVDGLPSTQGTPINFMPHAVGLYLDVHTSATKVSGNTFANADFGIHILDAYNNTATANLFFGNRQNQSWMQQRMREVNATQGDVFNNVMRANNFFPTTASASISHSTTTTSAAGMGSYDFDTYSTLLSATIATENTSKGNRSLAFRDWQADVGPTGARALDSNGRITAPLNGRAVGLMGSPLIAPGNVAIGTGGTTNGWGRFGSPVPPTVSQGPCPVGVTSCVRVLSPPGNASLMTSPKFSAVKSTWYRISFDAAASSAGQNLSVVARNATTSATISPTLQAAGSTTWKRYSFMFQMLASAASTSNTTGARIDFQDVLPGQWLAISNLQITPVTAGGSDVPYSLLYNATRTPQFPSCPVANAVTCANYYSFADSTRVTWPARLDPLKAMVVFAPDPVLTDSDNDGIADSQDACPGTATGVVVDNRGCGFGR